MNKMFKTLDGWITGLRNDQNFKIEEMQKCLEIDEMHNDIVKINPIIDWTYGIKHGIMSKQITVHYNKLLDEGYPSIGCEPCTRAIKDR